MSQGTAFDGIVEATWLVVCDLLHASGHTDAATPSLKSHLKALLSSAYKQGVTDQKNESQAIVDTTVEVAESQQAQYAHMLIHWLMRMTNLTELVVSPNEIKVIHEEPPLAVEALDNGNYRYTRVKL